MSYIQYLFLLFCLINRQAVAIDNTQKAFFRLFAKPLIIHTNAITPVCRTDNDVYRHALLKAEPWAVQMYDASAKIPSGIMMGNYRHLGNYDECLGVESHRGISGRACIATINIVFMSAVQRRTGSTSVTPFIETILSKFKSKERLLSIPYKWLWCVPASCGSNDVLISLKSVFKHIQKDSNFITEIMIDDNSCTTLATQRHTKDTLDRTYLTILIFIGFAVIVSTFYDILTMDTSNSRHTDKKYLLMTSFSLYTNGASLFSTKSNRESLRSLYAIRFLSICCIVYFHCVTQNFVNSPWNLVQFIGKMESWRGPIILNLVMAVDTFLLLAGIVLAYTEIQRHEKTTHGYRLRDLPMFYLHRYMRITPSYMIIVGLYATIFPTFGSGPLWKEFTMKIRNATRDEWWHHLLHCLNFFPASIGLPQSWYLTLLMQLYLFSPCFLQMMLLKGIKPIISILIISCGIFISILSVFIITFNCRLADLPNWFRSPECIVDWKQSEINSYYICQAVYARMGPFLLGLILGYFFKQWKRIRPTIGSFGIIWGWIAAVLIFILVIFSPTSIRYYDEGYSRIRAAFYSSFYRILFASVIGWIIFATEFTDSGPIGGFLMWRGWIPLGKLTFSIYLSHFIVIFYHIGTMRTPPSLRTWDTIRDFIACMVLTMIPAIILCLCVEMPFGNLMRLLTNDENKIKNSRKKSLNRLSSLKEYKTVKIV